MPSRRSVTSAGVPLGIKNFEAPEYQYFGLLLHRLDCDEHILKLPGYLDVFRVKYQNLLYKCLFQLFGQRFRISVFLNQAGKIH